MTDWKLTGNFEQITCKIVKGISKKHPKHDPTNFEFKIHCLFPPSNCQYLPLLHQSGMSAWSAHKSCGYGKLIA